MVGVKLGLFGVNLAQGTSPDWLVETAQAAEAAGFDSIWMGEHVVLPSPRVPPSPMEPTDPALDIFLALTYIAAHTSTLRLATGIVISRSATRWCSPRRSRRSTC